MGPVRTAFLTVALVLTSLVLWVGGDIFAAIGLPPWLVRGFIPLLVGHLVWRIVQSVRLHRTFAALSRPTEIYGRGSLATLDDLHKAGFAAPVGPDSFIFGAKDGVLLHYPGFSHACVMAPNNAGKSESLATVNALHIAHNLFVTDKAGEVALLTHDHRSSHHGQRVIILNPWRVEGLPNHHFNPLDEVAGKVAREEIDAIDVARSIALIILPDPEHSGDNAFFRIAARDLIAWIIMALAYWQVETGEMVCNFTTLYRVLAGSQDDLELWLMRMMTMQPGHEALRAAAERLTSRLERSPKTFENILAEAQNALAIFDPLGPLGRSMEHSHFRLEDFKTKPMTIYLVVPPDKLRTYSAWTGVLTDVMVRTAMSKVHGGRRVTFLLDEFANLAPGPLPSIVPALYLGRGLGCRLIYMVQDRRSFERYGAESSAFITQAELTITWGFRNPDDAEWVEKRSGQRGIVTESPGIPASPLTSPDKISISLSEKPIPIISRYDALGLPRFKAIAFLAGTSPVIVDLVSYRTIDPLSSFAKQAVADADAAALYHL